MITSSAARLRRKVMVTFSSVPPLNKPVPITTWDSGLAPASPLIDPKACSSKAAKPSPSRSSFELSSKAQIVIGYSVLGCNPVKARLRPLPWLPIKLPFANRKSRHIEASAPPPLFEPRSLVSRPTEPMASTSNPILPENVFDQESPKSVSPAAIESQPL